MSSNVPYGEFLDAYSSFNSAIRSHIAFADSRPEIRAALTPTTRIAFLDIIARANIKKPHQPIWIKVETTARRLKVSEKTVSRTIKMMRTNGWIEASKAHDGRNNRGEFDGREYLLTPTMRRLMSLSNIQVADLPNDHSDDTEGDQHPTASSSKLEAAGQQPASASQVTQVPVPVADPLPPGSPLSKAMSILQRRAAQYLPKAQVSQPIEETQAVEPVEKPVENLVLPSEPEPEKCQDQTALSSGVIYKVNKVFSLKEASLHKGGLSGKPEGQNPKLPADLVSMQHELEISPGGICALMKLAKELGHRLQDIWKVKRDQLLNSGAKQGRAFKYMRFLLTCGEDFSYLARTSIASDAPQTTNQPSSVRAAAPSPSAAQGVAGSASGAVQTSASGATTKLQDIAKACRFKRFRHISNGMVVRFYDGVAEVTRGVERITEAGWSGLQGYYVGISAGNLVEVRD